jgi:hypothetical protein
MFEAQQVDLPTLSCNSGESRTVIIRLVMKDKSVHLNHDAPNGYTATSQNDVTSTHTGKTKITDDKIELVIKKEKAGSGSILVDTSLYVCNDSGMCTKKDVHFSFAVQDGESDQVTTHKYTVTF